MSFHSEMTQAVKELKRGTREAIESAYNDIYRTLTSKDFDWAYAGLKFSSMEKDVIGRLALAAEEDFRTAVKREAKKAELETSEVELYWANVYHNMDSSMPKFEYMDSSRVDAISPPLPGRPEVKPPERMPRGIPVGAMVIGVLVLGLPAYLLTKQPFICVGGSVVGGVFGCIAYFLLKKPGTRRQQPLRSDMQKETKDWTAFQLLCVKCAQRAILCFDKWYDQSLAAALNVWPR